MPSVTVTGSSITSLVQYITNQAAPYAQTLATVISESLAAGTMQAFHYASGTVAPGPVATDDGVVFITATPSTAVMIPTTDLGVVISDSGRTSITGGAAGGYVIAGSGGLSYTDITPSGPGVTYIAAGDLANLITTTPGTTGNYQVNTGLGNDTISVNGNSMINAGTGSNDISVSGGNAYIYSEGHDIIHGGGGTDTINIDNGQATIDPGSSNLFIFGNTTTTNPLLVQAGTGSDTISVGSGGGNVTAGSGGNSILFGGAGGQSSAMTVLQGTANGDQIFAIGAGVVNATAGAGNETITGAGGAPNGFSVPGSTANNTFTAGTGNDTLIAGAGNDTLQGGSGTALMMSGTGADTFAFEDGLASHDTVTGFKSTDTLQLNGFNISTVPAVTSGGSTIISLTDGTTITLSGVTGLNPNQVALK